MQLVISLNEERRNKEQEDIADLPWLTDRDLVQIRQELIFLRQGSHGSKPLWFRTDVLGRYKNHRYCKVDMANPFSCVLIFLEYDKKHVAAFTLFEIHHGNIIMIRSQYFLGVPPKERNHWQKYQTMDNLHSYT
jgi:hypothetical protein